MKRLIAKPYYFFWGLVPLILPASFAMGDTVYFLNAYSLHQAVPFRELGFLFAALSLAVGAAYWMVLKRRRKLSEKLNALHILATPAGPVGALVASLLHRDIDLPVTDLLGYAADSQFNDRLLIASAVLWAITLLGQIALPLNLWRSFRPKGVK